jgi:hypothetical protein
VVFSAFFTLIFLLPFLLNIGAEHNKNIETKNIINQDQNKKEPNKEEIDEYLKKVYTYYEYNGEATKEISNFKSRFNLNKGKKDIYFDFITSNSRTIGAGNGTVYLYFHNNSTWTSGDINGIIQLLPDPKQYDLVFEETEVIYNNLEHEMISCGSILKKNLCEDFTYQNNYSNQLAYPVTQAALLKNNEFVKNYMASGFNINIQGENGYSILENSLSNKNIDLFDYVLDQNPDVNVKTGNGKAIIHHVVIKQVPYEIPILIDHGADVNAKDNEGITPIMEAAMDGLVEPEANREIVQMLLENGADLNIKDQNGLSAYDYAIKYHNPNIDLFK